MTDEWAKAAKAFYNNGVPASGGGRGDDDRKGNNASAVRPVTITIEGQFATFELAILLGLLRRLNGPDSPRHWNITIKDDGMAVAEAEDLLRRFFPVVSTHPRQ
jgi:hypothetical protein